MKKMVKVVAEDPKAKEKVKVAKEKVITDFTISLDMFTDGQCPKVSFSNHLFIFFLCSIL